MADTVHFTVRVPADADGFIPRRCPYCRGTFKVPTGDVDALPWLRLTCARCGLSAGFGDFTPPDVLAAATTQAMNYARGQIDAMLGAFARDVNGRDRPGQLVRMRVEHRPATPERVPRVRAITDLAVADLPCCGTRVKLGFALAASLFYCPVCAQAQT